MPSKYQTTIKMPHSINYKKQNQAKAKHHVYKSLSPSPSTTKSLVCFSFRYLMALFHPIRVSLPSIHVTSVFFPSIGANTFFCSLLLLRCVFLFLIWCCIVIHLCCLVVLHCNSLLLFLDATFLLKNAYLLTIIIVQWCVVVAPWPCCCYYLTFHCLLFVFVASQHLITHFDYSPTLHCYYLLLLLLFIFIITHQHNMQHTKLSTFWPIVPCQCFNSTHYYYLLLVLFLFDLVLPLMFYKCGRRSLKLWFFQIKASSSSFQIQVCSR